MTQTADLNMTLAPGVIDTIISIAATEVDGVASVGEPNTASGLFGLFNAQPSNKGVTANFDAEGKLEVELHLSVYYGYPLTKLAESVRQMVNDALLVQVAVECSRVDIFIDSIKFEQ
jgi:uncharacterized alkaline shock family protein YloU